MTVIKCLIFLSIALAVHVVDADVGIATYYTTYKPSACNGFDEDGTMIAAASDEIWDNMAACGRFYKVTCIDGFFANDPQPCITGASVIVKIVDHCPGCNVTIILSQEAFETIANIDGQKINMIYRRV